MFDLWSFSCKLQILTAIVIKTSSIFQREVCLLFLEYTVSYCQHEFIVSFPLLSNGLIDFVSNGGKL